MKYSASGASAKEFFVFEESTGIGSLTPDPSSARSKGTLDPSRKGEGSNYWYTIDGRRLQGNPSTKGIYIKDGIKTVIK